MYAYLIKYSNKDITDEVFETEDEEGVICIFYVSDEVEHSADVPDLISVASYETYVVGCVEVGEEFYLLSL
jgi:hypothetical protein